MFILDAVLRFGALFRLLAVIMLALSAKSARQTRLSPRRLRRRRCKSRQGHGQVTHSLRGPALFIDSAHKLRITPAPARIATALRAGFISTTLRKIAVKKKDLAAGS